MTSLFDLDYFGSLNDASRDFEIEAAATAAGISSKKNSSRKVSSKKNSGNYKTKFDSAWDTGAAFPELKQDFSVGDRVQLIGTDRCGIVAEFYAYHSGLIAWEDNLDDLEAYSISSKNFQKICTNSLSLTSAQESVQVSYTRELEADLTSEELQKSTTTAVQSLDGATQAQQTLGMSKNSLLVQSYHQRKLLTLSPPLRLAPHFQLRVNDLEQTMSATVSLPYCRLSIDYSQSSQLSKMSLAYSTVHIDQEVIAPTSDMFLSSYPQVGTMQSGLLAAAPSLAVPSLESGYCWLPSPGALSTTIGKRPPGISKLESWLRQSQLIEKGQVINPDYLFHWFGMPNDWVSSLELNPVTQTSEVSEKLLEICLTPEWLRSLWIESDICTPCQKNNAEIFLEENRQVLNTPKVEPKASKQRGCLYRYLEHKKAKNGQIISYPKMISNRCNDEPSHWRWGFNWEEKIDGEWKGRSIAAIPCAAIELIKSMQERKLNLEDIILFIRKIKTKRSKL